MSSKLLKYSAYIFKEKNNFLFFPKTLKQFLGWKFRLKRKLFEIRWLKNKAFFGSITDKAMKLFE